MSWWWQPFAAGHAFGRTSLDGATPSPLFGNYKVACNYTLDEDGAVDAIFAYMDGQGTGVGDQPVAASIYTNHVPAGFNRPLTLLGTSSEVVVADGQEPGWVRFSFSSPVTVAAGIVWFSFHTGPAATSGETINIYTALVSGAGTSVLRVVNGDAYPGPDSPWGTPAGDEAEKSDVAYATYTPVSIVDLAATVAGQAAVTAAQAPTRAVAATVAGQGTVAAAAPTLTRRMPVTVAGQGAVAPSVSITGAPVIKDMAVAVAGQAALTLPFNRTRAVSVPAAGQATAAAAVGRVVRVAAGVAGQGALAVTPGRARGLPAVVAGQGQVSAASTRVTAVDVAIDGDSQLSAVTSPVVRLSADILGGGGGVYLPSYDDDYETDAVVVDLTVVPGPILTVFDVAVAGQAGLAADAKVLRGLAATAAGQGALTAQAIPLRGLAAPIVGQGAVVSAQSPVRGLEAGVGGTSTIVIATAGVLHALDTTVAGQGVLAAPIEVASAAFVSLDVFVGGQGQLSVAQLGVVRPFASSVAGQGAVAAAANPLRSLAVVVAGTGAVTDALVRFKDMEALVSGQATVTPGTPQMARGMAASVQGQASVLAALRATKILQALVAGQGQLSAVTEAGVPWLVPMFADELLLIPMGFDTGQPDVVNVGERRVGTFRVGQRIEDPSDPFATLLLVPVGVDSH